MVLGRLEFRDGHTFRAHVPEIPLQNVWPALLNVVIAFHVQNKLLFLFAFQLQGLGSHVPTFKILRSYRYFEFFSGKLFRINKTDARCIEIKRLYAAPLCPHP